MTEPEGTVLMTGASRGLGRHAALHLLRTAPDRHLLLTVRGAAGARLAAELAAESGNPHVSVVPGELASLADVRACAAEVGRRLTDGGLPPLRGFLGNAGLQLTSAAKTTADGVELTFGVNVLANHLLIRLLCDRLHTPARIVVVGSDVHFGDLRHNLGMVPAPQWTDPDVLAEPGAESVRAGRRAYATSKLGVLYLVHALARRLPDGVDAYTYNPGFVPGTDLTRDAGPVTRLLARTVLHAARATPFATGPAAAGRRLAATMTGPRPGPSGSYLDRGALARSSPESYDEAREEALWAWCARRAVAQ